jgi:hypothetical protein
MHRSTYATIVSATLASLVLAGGCATEGVDTSEDSLRIITPTARDLSEPARAAIIEAVSARTEFTGPWSLISLRQEATWALGTVTPADLNQPMAEHEESHLDLDNMYAVLLVQTAAGWEAALEGDDYVHELLELVPESELALSARRDIFPRKDDVRASVYSGYKFFWPAGNGWLVTQGWHDSYTWGGRFPAYTSLDLDITGATNSDILAGAPGTVTYMCNDGTQVLVGITTSGTSENVGYLHLDSATVASAGITNGMSITMGKKLGRMLNSDGGTISTSCGTSSGTHVHMYLPSTNITIDGVAFTSSNWHSGQYLYSTQGSSTTEVIVDDQSSGFYKYGPSSYWWQAYIGYAGHMWYTYDNGTVKSNYTRWYPGLPSAGNYTVYAYIPSNYATSQQAKYRIYHNGGNNYSTLNQNSYYNAWVSLGTHYFSGNGTEYVELGDNTGEAGSTNRMIGFDAIKFVK